MAQDSNSKSLISDYLAVRAGGAGLIDLSARGRLLVSGSEAALFLNGLITHDMKTLELNSRMPAAFANVQGRLLAAVRVIHRDDGFVIDTENATAETLVKLLERFTFAGDFHLRDVADVMQLSIQGKAAAEMLGGVLGEDLSSLSRAGAQTVTDKACEILRIEAGIGHYGVDMDESNVVTETNLEDAVSFTKGCSLGQEIIVRIQHRGHVATKLTGIGFEKGAAIESGTKIFSADKKEIGRVTSSTFSPHLDRTIALGY